MLFNSLQFMIFFPLVVLGYYVIPKRLKSLWLLICSYYFYMSWNPIYILLILFTTVVTYGAGRVLEVSVGKVRKIVLFGGVALNLGILGYYKYYNFLAANICGILNKVRVEIQIPKFDVILPIGISFYTFQALGYLIDVYRKDILAEQSFLRYALFCSFFPQLAAGPIEKAADMLPQYTHEHKWDYEQVREGLMVMLWGFFLKLVLADRIAVLVDTVYSDHQTYGGYYLIVASILFAFQIYGDFAGYSTIALGAAKVLGINLSDNFNSPYLARNVADFWRRWHVTLMRWFRNYVYIPFGGNRKGVIRKYVNILIVFGLSGLWHGASWNFVAWGLLNGLYQILGQTLMPVRNRIVKFFKMNRKSFSHKLYQTVVTFVLVDFAWVFFRADSLRDGIEMVRSMANADNTYVLFDDSLFRLGLDWKNFMVMLAGIFLLMMVDYFKNKGVMIRKLICRQELWFRWAVLLLGIVTVLTVGIWGSGYDAKAFIYFQF